MRVRRLIQVLAVVAALTVAGVAAAAPGSWTLFGEPGDPIRVTVTSGLLFSSDNSRAGQAVLTAQNMVPGDVVTGEVQISSGGALKGEYRLTASDLTDRPGLGGGVLSERLRIAIDEEGRPGRLFEGTLAELRSIGLGVFASGERRTYRFTATLPAGDAAGDDAFQGAAAGVTLRWTAASCVGC